MAINFPDSPSVNDTHTVGDRVWNWNGTYWTLKQNASTYSASDTAPSSPDGGDLWYESDTGNLYVYYGSVWVEVGHATDGGTALADADGDTLIQVEESADEDTIRFDTAGTERMVIKSDGKVGIGTTTPLEQVEIAGVNDRTALRLSGAGGSSSVTGKVYLGMHQWASGANPSVRIGAEEISASNYDANLVFQTRDSGSDVLPTTRMTIDHTGKVGIGTSTPSYILHVVEGSNSWQFNGSGNLVVDPGHVRAQTSGADGGIVLGQCFSTSYVGLRTNGMSETGSEYIIMSNGTNTYVSAGSGGILYLRGPANDTNPQIQIDSSVITVQESSATMMSFRYTSSSTGSGYLSFNSSTDTQIGTIGMNTNDDMRLYCHKSGGHIFFGAGNAWRWYISSSGHLLPYASAAYNLGAYYAQVDNVYIDDMATFSGSGYATCRRRDDGYVTANDGQIMELTSSERFKTDITPLTLPEAEKVLGCRPIIYRDKAEAETNPDSGFYAGISAESLQEAGYEWPLKYDKGEDCT